VPRRDTPSSEKRISLGELEEKASRLATKRAKIVALILDTSGATDTLTRKDLDEVLRLAYVARSEAQRSYKWRGNSIVLCTENLC